MNPDAVFYGGPYLMTIYIYIYIYYRLHGLIYSPKLLAKCAVGKTNTNIRYIHTQMTA